MSFYFLFRNQINNYVLSQEQKFGKNQGINDENWKLGVITVLFKFSLVCKNWKFWLLLMEQNAWLK